MTSFYEELHKSDRMSDEKENAQSRVNVDRWIFRLLLLLIGVMPLIVFAHVEQVTSPLISNQDVLMSGTKGELFTYFKAFFVLIVTFIAGALLLAKVFLMGGTIRKTTLNYALAVLAIMVVIATIASPNISVTLSGLYNRSDGAISWLCYIALMFIAMNIEYPKHVMKYILYTLMPFVVINLFIITMNFYGKDLLQNNWVKSFVSSTLPEGASIGEGSQLLGTLNQWNYMSGMFAIMTVMYLMAAILGKTKKNAYSYLIFAIMSITVLFMSLSTTGFLTFIVLLPMILFVALKNVNRVKSLTIIAIFIVATIPIFHILASKEAGIWTESIGFIIDSNPYIETPKEVSKESGSYHFDWENRAYASDDFEIPTLLKHGTISKGSGRIYIWEKTFNLISERPFLGYGLDTLLYNFPHNNIDARAGILTETVIVDKPHNMYIGMLYGTGWIGFIAMIMVIGISFIRSLKAITQVNNEAVWIIGIAWLAYLIQAIFNDSLPSISAPMWVLAGIMMALTFTHKEIKNGRNN
ncbi:O-antigen ligase family protein [Metasolibacillus sp.]|uniref:O-antigen ligase family protein n=1 Tax=Metasolibacillus sp. TaxID=2703680 RepID=UPI0025E17CA4|nr:O-antigen ligase family protein [Metasolibacillus sp.]MCT6923391.1 O-antigen ligase family protein [Metasolibacillus sp.]MCT6939886.1 O-antigen ligase family protein [Metasolibacillus sp.]